MHGPLGGRLVLGVAGVRSHWVTVTAKALPNGHYAWADFGHDVAVHPIQWTLHTSLSGECSPPPKGLRLHSALLSVRASSS